MSRLRQLSLWALGLLFVGAGVMHFVAPEPYLRILPPWLPAPGALVLLSGVAEVAGGLGLLIPRARRLAGWGIAAMLLVFMTVHVHMVANAEAFADLAPAWALWLRLPLQFVLIAWVLWASRSSASP